MIVEIVKPETVIDLRHQVLRPHMTRAECKYPGDDATGTAHFGVRDKSGLIVAIASIYPENGSDDRAHDGWRIRGMAVLPEFKNQGLGSLLIDTAVEHIRRAGGTSVWCNARSSAYTFYEKNGFVRQGDEFDIPGIGLHSVMTRSLER